MARIGKAKTSHEPTMLGVIARAIDAVVVTCTVIFAISAGLLVGAKMFGYNEYVVLSGSMEPSIMTGSLAFINTKDTSATVGDVVAFTIDKEEADTSYDSDATTVTHRIVKVNSDGTFTTKGDNNESEDTKHISPEQVIGKYCFNIPKVGYVMSQINQRGMIAIICWIVAINLLTSAFVVLADR